MALNPDILVRYTRFDESQMADLRDCARKHPELLQLDEAVLRTHLSRIVDDRLAFAWRVVGTANDLLTLAQSGSLADTDMIYRTALMKAYYACFHACRALHLDFRGWDPDSHEATPGRIQSLVGTAPKLRAHFGKFSNINIELKRLLELRYVADYDIYDRRRPNDPAVDFGSETPSAVAYARGLLPLIESAVVNRRSGGFR